ncbi:hypothetical protein Dsin_028616 [Dipteronia sinensis]|uniref:Uncharacterized protein n=1 Tax=Dipteronia sinensis TaxID=43782 RepID=A0AAE0DUK7_9ROSI|nr:hypothetical protein Dsin_028616 [Dipteronia sinensis]
MGMHPCHLTSILSLRWQPNHAGKCFSRNAECGAIDYQLLEWTDEQHAYAKIWFSSPVIKGTSGEQIHDLRDKTSEIVFRPEERGLPIPLHQQVPPITKPSISISMLVTSSNLSNG